MKFYQLIFIILAVSACSRRVATPMLDVLSKDAQGLVTIAATGTGFKQATAEQDARRLVLERLLYTGIADENVSDVRLPLIADANKLSGEQKRKLETLLSPPQSDRYFQALSKTDPKPQWSENLKRNQNFVLKVNYDMLRKDLESQSIIRKFGL